MPAASNRPERPIFAVLNDIAAGGRSSSPDMRGLDFHNRYENNELSQSDLQRAWIQGCEASPESGQSRSWRLK